LPGPYYPLSTLDTVPRAYEIFMAYERMGGRKNKKNEKMGKFNIIKIQHFKNTNF
jgi:hypothetical protein